MPAERHQRRTAATKKKSTAVTAAVLVALAGLMRTPCQAFTLTPAPKESPHVRLVQDRTQLPVYRSAAPRKPSPRRAEKAACWLLQRRVHARAKPGARPRASCTHSLRRFAQARACVCRVRSTALVVKHSPSNGEGQKKKGAFLKEAQSCPPLSPPTFASRRGGDCATALRWTSRT